MADIYKSLTYEQRTRMQAKMKAAGVYSLAIDGIYGPGTEGGLIRGAAFLNNKANASVINLSTRKGVANFYRGVLNGSFDKYIYR